MYKVATMAATPNEIVTMLVEMVAAIKSENALAPDALLCAKKGGKGGNGGNGSKGSNESESPRRDKSDNKDDGNKKNLRRSSHCQQQAHLASNCFSMQCGDPPQAADTAANASTVAVATSSLTMSIEYY